MSDTMLTHHIRLHIGINSHTKTFSIFPHALIIHALEITMLSCDEEVTPTVSLSPSSSRSGPLLAVRFSGQTATLPEAPNKHTATSALPQGMPTAPPLITDSKRRIHVADKRIINGITNVSQWVPFKSQWTWEKYLSSSANQHIVVSLGPDQGEIFNACSEVQSIVDKDGVLIPVIDAITAPQFKTGTPEADQSLLKALIAFPCLAEGQLFYVDFTQIVALDRRKHDGARGQARRVHRATRPAVHRCIPVQRPTARYCPSARHTN